MTRWPTLTGCSKQEAPPPRAHPLPCLNASGQLSLPLLWGDPQARQVPLFVNWEDLAGKGYLPADLRGVSFVQIGANCGKNTYGCAVGGDPVWSYATMCGWRGVAVEPVSYVFSKLCQNYARWPLVVPLRGAVADASTWMMMKLGHGESNKLMHISHSLRPASDRSKLQNNETVPVVDLAGLWTQMRPWLSGKVDLLVIDAEGAEGKILGGGAPLPRPRPSLILFEHVHLPRVQQETIDAKLLREGYKHLQDLRNMDPRGARRRPANRLYGLPTSARGATSWRAKVE